MTGILDDTDDFLDFLNNNEKNDNIISNEQQQIDKFLNDVINNNNKVVKKKLSGEEKRTRDQKKRSRRKGREGLDKLYDDEKEMKLNSKKKGKRTKKKRTIRDTYLLKSLKYLPKIQRYFTPNQQQKLVEIFIKQNSKYLNNYDLERYFKELPIYNTLNKNLNINTNKPIDYNFKNVQDFLQQSEYYKSALEDIYKSNELSKNLQKKLENFLKKYDSIIVAEGSKGKKRRQRKRGKCTKKRKKRKDNAGCSCTDSINCDCRRMAQLQQRLHIENIKTEIRVMILFFSQHKEKVLEILNSRQIDDIFYNKLKKYIYIQDNKLIIDMDYAKTYNDLIDIKNLFYIFQEKLKKKIKDDEEADRLLRKFVNEQRIPSARVAPATIMGNIDERTPRWNSIKRGVKKTVNTILNRITRRGRNNRRGRNSIRIQPAFIVGEKKNTRRKKGKKRKKKK